MVFKNKTGKSKKLYAEKNMENHRKYGGFLRFFVRFGEEKGEKIKIRTGIWEKLAQRMLKYKV